MRRKGLEERNVIGERARERKEVKMVEDRDAEVEERRMMDLEVVSCLWFPEGDTGTNVLTCLLRL